MPYLPPTEQSMLEQVDSSQDRGALMVGPINANTSAITYTKCFSHIPLKDRARVAMEASNKTEWERVLHVHHGLIPIPFNVVATIVVIFYILSVRQAMREHRVSRKFYSLLLNRAIGDLVACITCTVTIFYSLYWTHDTGMVQILNTTFIASFWAGMCSYVAQSVMKLYGVARPLQYRRYITMARCKQFCVASWVLFVVCIIYTGSMVALTTIPKLQKMSKCTSESCLHPMYVGRNGLVVIVYLFTLVCFGVTVVLIRRAKSRSESFHSNAAGERNREAVKRKFRYPLLKLALHVSTFAIFNFPYFCWALTLTIAGGCFYPLHYNRMVMLSAWVRMSLLTRIIVDSVLSLALETEVKRSFLRLLPCTKRVAPQPASSSSIPNRLNTVKSGTVSVCDSSDYSNADNTAPLTEKEKGQQRSVSERGLIQKRLEPAELEDKKVIEVIPE
ncbi:unnamed protein product [Bursaphelenchus xylophilus]|uniref:(pine wood nematode) hypothetical protein n=1 Tax=Bursaphelenchus xylophilus TaxID=6326 RepID=A0A7I8X960_BURXY|nr:unnamed protein product [Bursaphelenchus xylophilus]CAG9118818.1 unnamed protein product [Bursaphelenchus xylophilus]